jgi:uncharacterized paraquat-inducible protein A
MSRYYAIFSNKYPLIHKINIAGIALLSLISAYQLLVNEEYIYIAVLVINLMSIIIFERSSEYKRKYLTR